MSRVYIAGPMRGYAEFNFPMFYKAEEMLTDAGYTVFNPARRDAERGFDPTGLTGSEALEPLGFNLREALLADLTWIIENAEMVAVLPRYVRSKGATAEVAVAQALGLPIRLVEDLCDPRLRDEGNHA